jgi:hypothetical protein
VKTAVVLKSCATTPFFNVIASSGSAALKASAMPLGVEHGFLLWRLLVTVAVSGKQLGMVAKNRQGATSLF